MTSMAEKGNRKLSFILYEKSGSPRYFEISPRLLKFFFIGLPIFSLICLGGVLAGSLYFQQIRELAKRKEPEIISKLRSQNLELQKTQAKYLGINKELQNKLLVGAPTPLQSLGLFKSTAGQGDLTHKSPLVVKNIRGAVKSGKFYLNFDLENVTSNNEKVAGYAFVLMKGSNSIHYFPEASIPENEMQLLFNRGEHFVTSRFRPVEASFPLPAKTSDVLFKILVFSRNGDLMVKKLISQKVNI